MQEYQTIDGKVIQVDETQKYRLPHVNSMGISYPEIGSVKGFMAVFQREAFEGRTVEVAKDAMQELERYLHSRDERGKALFIDCHNTPLFVPTDGSRSDTKKLGTTYDELFNTYRILEQIVEG